MASRIEWLGVVEAEKKRLAVGERMQDNGYR